METALRTRVIAAVGHNRVTWGIRPIGGTLPAVVLTIVSDVRTQNMDGLDGFQSKRVQIDCYATTYADAATAREAVIAAIVPGATTGGTVFLRSFVNNTMSRTEETATDPVHRQMLDLTIWHD